MTMSNRCRAADIRGPLEHGHRYRSGNEAFESLPVEVRCLIWRYTFESNNYFIVRVNEGQPLGNAFFGIRSYYMHRDDKYDLDVQASVYVLTSVLLTCRLFWRDQEAYQPFYKFNEFRFTSMDILVIYLAAITPRRRQSIRHITLGGYASRYIRGHHVSYRGIGENRRLVEYKRDEIAAVLSQCTDLRTLQLNIDITNKWFDEENVSGSTTSAFNIDPKEVFRNIITDLPILSGGLFMLQTLHIILKGCMLYHEYSIQRNSARLDTMLSTCQSTGLPRPFEKTTVYLSLESEVEIATLCKILTMASESDNDSQGSIHRAHLQKAYEKCQLRVFGEGRNNAEKNSYFVSGRTRGLYEAVRCPVSPNGISLSSASFSAAVPVGGINAVRMNTCGEKPLIQILLDDPFHWQSVKDIVNLELPDEESQACIDQICRVFRFGIRQTKVSDLPSIENMPDPYLLIEDVKNMSWEHRSVEEKAVKSLARLQKQLDKRRQIAARHS